MFYIHLESIGGCQQQTHRQFWFFKYDQNEEYCIASLIL